MLNKKDAALKLARLMEVKELKKALEAEEKALEDAFKNEMVRKDVMEIVVGDKVVRWTPYSSERFDSKGFKAANPDEYAKWMKVVNSRRFSVA